MKTRFGYVSNSSSSSFIVVLKDKHGQFRHDVTYDQEMLLYGYGFRYVGGDWKSALMYGSELFNDRKDIPEDGSISMYYDVTCNEDEVEEFLFWNKIPFVASEHYDMRLVDYDGKHDYYDTFYNDGIRHLMYGVGNGDDLMMQIAPRMRPFTRTRISDGADITDTVKGIESNKGEQK